MTPSNLHQTDVGKMRRWPTCRWTKSQTWVTTRTMTIWYLPGGEVAAERMFGSGTILLYHIIIFQSNADELFIVRWIYSILVQSYLWTSAAQLHMHNSRIKIVGIFSLTSRSFQKRKHRKDDNDSRTCPCRSTYVGKRWYLNVYALPSEPRDIE